MRILVVCGAGASSTFVAQRVRHAAQTAGVECTAVAGTTQSLPIDLDAADIVLLGPHLEHSIDDIRRDAAPRGVAVVLLPADIFGDLSGERTLDLVLAALDSAARGPSLAPSPSEGAR